MNAGGETSAAGVFVPGGVLDADRSRAHTLPDDLPAEASAILSGRVLITGGSGFLGRAILRRAAAENWPATFTVYSRDETKQWQLANRFPDVRCVLGDIARATVDDLATVFDGQDVVIHAGALKFIDVAELNVFETVAVNVDGVATVASAARKAGVRTVVGISTDKACEPLNTYGATKLLMERLFAEANAWGETEFVTVRYGNVVGSTGSVIPVFRQQIERFGEIRVTDARMTRFWLSPDQAVELVERAVTNAPAVRGYTFVAACPAMSILELAKTVSEMAPLKVPITISGLRPGEKLAELLYNAAEWPRVHYFRNGPDFLLAPPASRVALAAEKPSVIGDQPASREYSSAAARRQVSRDEMRAMIADAETI